MSDLEALAKLAQEATPGPWHNHPHEVSGDGWEQSVFWTGGDRDRTPRVIVARADSPDAAYIAAASPDVVLALVHVVLAARAFMGDDYTWDREANGDPGPALNRALADLAG